MCREMAQDNIGKVLGTFATCNTMCIILYGGSKGHSANLSMQLIQNAV